MDVAQQRPDDEWYLRRVGEDGLVGGVMDLLRPRARALVAVRRISSANAVAILHAYGRALALRHEDDGFEPTTDSSTLPTAMRVSACARTVPQEWGSVRLDYVVWTGDRTRLRAALTRTNPEVVATPARMPRRYFGPIGYAGPPSITLVDQRGRPHEGYFSGGGSDRHWDGTFTFEPGLPANASWFTIYGERVDLAANPTDVQVRLVPTVPDTTPEELAERYLNFCIESSQRDYEETSGVDLAIETFLHTGVLRADSPAIRGARAASEALGHAVRFQRRLRRRHVSTSPDLPAQWRSVLARRGRKDGIVHTQVVGAITPAFDGIALCVLALTSRADDFEIDIDAALSPNPLQSEQDVDRRFTVTAVDDRGNHYLGETREYNGGEDSLSCTIAFGAPLDPLATTVDIAVSTGLAQAVVTVALHRAQPT